MRRQLACPGSACAPTRKRSRRGHVPPAGAAPAPYGARSPLPRPLRPRPAGRRARRGIRRLTSLPPTASGCATAACCAWVRMPTSWSSTLRGSPIAPPTPTHQFRDRRRARDRRGQLAPRDGQLTGGGTGGAGAELARPCADASGPGASALPRRLADPIGQRAGPPHLDLGRTLIMRFASMSSRRPESGGRPGNDLQTRAAAGRFPPGARLAKAPSAVAPRGANPEYALCV